MNRRLWLRNGRSIVGICLRLLSGSSRLVVWIVYKGTICLSWKRVLGLSRVHVVRSEFSSAGSAATVETEDGGSC